MCFKDFFFKVGGLLSCLALLCIFSTKVEAKEIYGMRIGQGVGSVRIAFDAQNTFDYKVFMLNDPKRLVIDVENIKVSSKIEKVKDKSNLIEGLRLGNDNRRIVFDLKKPVVVKKAFMLPPQSSFPWRFAIDLQIASEREFLNKTGFENAVSTSKDFKESSYDNKVTAVNQPIKTSKKIIVLDAGHGGRDPGAIGYSGVYEKHITLSMAKELKAILDQTGKYQVYLTRSTDKILALRERVKIARAHKADLFISIHADSARNKKATGLSVYTLSETASDKEAAALAERENKADVIAGLDFAEHTREVADILINLAQRETMNRSSEFASFMVEQMRKKVHLVADTHRFAGFAVLKAPDIPSVLLEMGYLSNRQEEKLLKQKEYRKKLAISVKNAINKYFENMQRASLF